MHINSTYFERNLQNNLKNLTSYTQKLSTGKRINSASDDASGLQISTRMTAQNRGNAQAIRNIQDGVSLLKTTDGSLATIQDMLQRIRELSVQGKNGTYTTEEKQSIQKEIQSLMDGVNQIAKNTNFNGISLLMGKSVDLSGVPSEDKRVRIDNIPVDTTLGAKTTVEFWMNWNGNNNAMPLYFNGCPDIWMHNGSIGINTGNSDLIGTSSSGLKNSWNHIAVTFANGVPNTSNVEIYINGEKQPISELENPSHNSITAKSTVWLGGTANSYEYAGKVDELKIWSGVRTEDEIKIDMYFPNSGNEENLLGYWKFDDEALKDETSNGNNGQSVNGASISDGGISKSISIHSSGQKSDRDIISLLSVSDETLNLKNLSLDDQEMLNKIDDAINGISIQRGTIGAKINRYQFKINNLENTINNTEAAQMRIADQDMAGAMAELTKADILMNATQQMLKTNNSMYQQKMQMLLN